MQIVKKEKMQKVQETIQRMTGLSGPTPIGLSGPEANSAKDQKAAKWHALSMVTGEFIRLSDYPVNRIIRSQNDRIIRSKERKRLRTKRPPGVMLTVG